MAPVLGKNLFTLYINGIKKDGAFCALTSLLFERHSDDFSSSYRGFP